MNRADKPPSENQFARLPNELKAQFFSFFQKQELQTLRRVCHDFQREIDAPLVRKYTGRAPAEILRKIETLPRRYIFSFVRYCEQHLDLDFGDSPYTIIFQALTTNDINQIDPKKLEEAIAAVSEVGEQNFTVLLSSLRITLAGIEGKVLEVATMLKERSGVKPYVNLSGASLSGINLSKDAYVRSDYDLAFVNLQNADLSLAKFDGFNIKDFEFVNLKNASLPDTKLFSKSSLVCILQ